MADFDDISKELSCHFCSRCGASFECDDEEGYCDCPFSDHFSEVMCDSCTECELNEQEEEQRLEREEREKERNGDD